MVLHKHLLDVSLFVDIENVQVVNIIQGSPSSQLVGMGETGQRIPLIETGDIIVKVHARVFCNGSHNNFSEGELSFRPDASSGFFHNTRTFNSFNSQARRKNYISYC